MIANFSSAHRRYHFLWARTCPLEFAFVLFLTLRLLMVDLDSQIWPRFASLAPTRIASRRAVC